MANWFSNNFPLPNSTLAKMAHGKENKMSSSQSYVYPFVRRGEGGNRFFCRAQEFF
jgi:hypothetical protein